MARKPSRDSIRLTAPVLMGAATRFSRIGEVGMAVALREKAPRRAAVVSFMLAW